MTSAIGDARNVDLNSSTPEELDRVGGLGQERVQRLIESRPFHSWDDLKKVPGFSDKLVEDLKGAGATLGSKR